jgi:hypothetical protein
MGLHAKCDWCAEEPNVKLRLPEQRIVLPKSWKFTMLDGDSVREGEVVVSCSKKCRKQLVEVHADIKKAREEKRRQEEKKLKKKLGL